MLCRKLTLSILCWCLRLAQKLLHTTRRGWNIQLNVVTCTTFPQKFVQANKTCFGTVCATLCCNCHTAHKITSKYSLQIIVIAVKPRAESGCSSNSNSFCHTAMLFSDASLTIWNSLPDNGVNSDTCATFNKRLKTHFLSLHHVKCFCHQAPPHTLYKFYCCIISYCKINSLYSPLDKFVTKFLSAKSRSAVNSLSLYSVRQKVCCKNVTIFGCSW